MAIAFGRDNASQVIDNAIEFGIFEAMQNVLNSGTKECQAHVLFGLSNLTAELGYSLHFLDREQLVGQVIQLASQNDHKLKCEALWTLSNAITTTQGPTNQRMFHQHGQRLLKPFIENLQIHHTIDKNLLKELLQSLDNLLKLDDDYPAEGNVQSVNNMFAELDGPEALTEIINNCQNQHLSTQAN